VILLLVELTKQFTFKISRPRKIKNFKNYFRLKDIPTKYIAHKGKTSLNDMTIELRQGVREPDA
jgi:hypothetical protein